MRHFLVVPAAVSLLWTSTAFAQNPLTGIVSDAYTGVRVEGVIVADSASGATATTDHGGQFSMNCRAPMTIVLRRAGYQTGQQRVTSCESTVRVSLIPGAQGLSTVNVVAERPKPEIAQTQGSTTLSPIDLNRGTGLLLQDAVNLTPGVRMQTRTMFGGQTFSIRGYGRGSDATNFVGTGFKAYYNGIPVTDAEGATRLDDVDVAGLGRVDIIRGPSSSLYGGGIGGVVDMYTAEPHELGTNFRQETMGGQYGLLRSTTRVEHVSDGATTMLSYGHQTYDSYRVASDSKKDFINLLGDFRPSDRQSIYTFVSYAKSHDMRAGELDSAQFAQKLNMGNDRYVGNRARQDIQSFRAGVTHRYDLTSRLENATTAFFSGYNLDDVYAAGLNARTAQTFGARTVFNARMNLGALPLSTTTGAEYEQTNQGLQGFGMTNAVLGPLRSNMDTRTMQSSVFTQWDASFGAGVTLTAGASVNFVTYSINDLFANTGNPDHQDGSGRKVFDPVVTPRVALRKELGPNASAYASISQGYAAPTAGDAVIPYTGEPNSDLEPERATQYEIGTRGSLLQNRLRYDIALFDLRVTDKLSSQAVDSAGVTLYSYTINAGDQNNRGLELSASYAVIDEPTAWLSSLRPFLSYTYSNAKYKNFQGDVTSDDMANDYTGKKVVGVAPNVVNFGLDASARFGGYLHATFHHEDAVPISYDNAHKAVAYSLVGAKVGVRRELGRGLTLDVFAGGDNLTNSLYYTQVFVNHKFVPGQPPPNMYLPGPYKATYYGGVNLSIRP